MDQKIFDEFWKENKPHLVAVINKLKKDIELPDFDTDLEQSGLDITVSVSENCQSWSYQTGDNSFTGSCYGDPYWGIGTIFHDSNSDKLADSLIGDLSEQIEFN